jgi:phosphoribosyl-AMP cyclohydrolase
VRAKAESRKPNPERNPNSENRTARFAGDLGLSGFGIAEVTIFRAKPHFLRYTSLRMSFYDQLKFDANGLIPAIIQEQANGRVLMMAWMNRASLEDTIKTGKTHFWSRSRKKYWMKGESSGHVQMVKDVAFDCDGDTLLIQVEQIGAACHEGYKSCFFRSIQDQGEKVNVTEPQLVKPEEVYGKKQVEEIRIPRTEPRRNSESQKPNSSL